MTVRVSSSSLIAGAVVVGDRGLGVLGSVIRSNTATGTHGAGYLYNDWDSGDDAKEFRGLIVTPPSSGTFYAYEDGSFSLVGAADGSYTFVYRLYVDGADLGTATSTINVGTAGAVATGSLPFASLTAPTGTGSATASAEASGSFPSLSLVAPEYATDRNGSAAGALSVAYLMPMVGSATGNVAAGGAVQGLRKTRYIPAQVPQDPAELTRFLQAELERLTDALESPFTHDLLEVLSVEPARKLEGMVVLADGSSWNPGSGKGVYVYYSGTWNRLG